jgi:hypothetical protein
VPSSPRVLLPAAALLAMACTDPVDRAAKQRIFSPEDPPAVVASAQEKLAADQLGTEARLAQRVLTMGAAEMTERLGPNRFTGDVSFDWSSAGQRVKLSETRLLESAAGGVGGDFHARLDNSRDQGLEVVRVRGQVFARSKYGKFRLRQRDRGIAERTREDTAGALRELVELFDRRIHLVPQGSVAVDGRPAYRYEVRLADSAGPSVQPVSLPAPAYARGGADDTTRRRRLFSDKRQPRSLSGELFVDAATAVVLRARLDGKLDVPAQPGVPAAQLHVQLEERIQDVGKSPTLRPPDGYLPDADKPEGIADALDRFGMPRQARPDAGVDTEADEDTAG